MIDLKVEEEKKDVILSQRIDQQKPADPKILVYDSKEYYSLWI